MGCSLRCLGFVMALLLCAPVLAQASDPLEPGRRMYMDGVLPSGESLVGVVQGDIEISGPQVICGNCHRRSGLGTSEGDQVVPGLTSALLYEPVTIPTSRPPAPPVLRPAYDDATVRRAIRDGVGASGAPLGSVMPRYALADDELDILLDYLKTLSPSSSPGVNETEIHFATIVTDGVPATQRKAMLDVMHTYIAQKNTETRHETKRATTGTWHKDWIFKSYRKWVLHVWELSGPSESWPAQLEAAYADTPVFAMLSGLAPGEWRPIHSFCERQKLPCLFPNTDLPVSDESSFYSVYFSRGMALEAQTVAMHLGQDGLSERPLVQVFDETEDAGRVAAAALRGARGGRVQDRPLTNAEADADFWRATLAAADGGVLVAWLNPAQQAPLWQALADHDEVARVYLSSALQDGAFDQIPPAVRERVRFSLSYEPAQRFPRLLARSTGWLRAKRIYDRDQQRLQANTFFALKAAGSALVGIRLYFVREYFLEQLEHMVDNANYTSVYSHMSLAPDQRFVSKGCYVAQLSESDPARLNVVSDWLIADKEQY